MHDKHQFSRRYCECFQANITRTKEYASKDMQKILILKLKIEKLPLDNLFERYVKKEMLSSYET